ncbi:hypothetical protein [Cohnella panacarvi]|uniref:hypothetical protein n=1 Tax=Cohnella panacarvi TaxID=400776 RepID=UPI0004B55C6D|nr:hypothetical protein [Cohnella panacarvi]
MEANIIFIIASFALAGVIIMMRDRIPQNLRRGLALTSIALVLFAFFLIVYSFYKAGS